MAERPPHIEFLGLHHSASPAEAAAVVAALERFMRETAPVPAPRPEALDRWRQAALLEGVSRDPMPDDRPLWINA